MTGHPLLVTLKAIIERSYGLPVVIDDLAPFIVGDDGYRRFYDGSPGTHAEGGVGARLLVRDGCSGLRAALYYPDALVGHLERHNPLCGVGDENIDAFAVLIEELDHLLIVASRAAERRSVSLLELEHHAGVTKYLVVLHFLARHSGRLRVTEPQRLWARHHLFERYAADGGEEGARYREAAALARRYVLYLEAMPVPRRLAELRAFQRRPFSETCLLAERVN